MLSFLHVCTASIWAFWRFTWQDVYWKKAESPQIYSTTPPKQAGCIQYLSGQRLMPLVFALLFTCHFVWINITTAGLLFSEVLILLSPWNWQTEENIGSKRFLVGLALLVRTMTIYFLFPLQLWFFCTCFLHPCSWDFSHTCCRTIPFVKKIPKL